MKIIIDSGHGGHDPGAVAFGKSEKDLNLVFAKLLASKLEQQNLNVDKSLIIDKYHSPEELTGLIKQSGASLCISCHNNAYNGAVRGFEIIHSIHTEGDLAQSILDEVKKTGFPVRKAYSRKSTSTANSGQDYYYIIRLTYPQVETLIIEFGFMDNTEDFKMLTDPAWQDKLTNAAATAIRKYYPAETDIKTQINGKSILTPSQLKKALKDANPDANSAIADTYYTIAQIYGIKADLAFLQSMHETNWLKFTGAVKKEQNNFAGLGAANGKSGESFPSVEAGVEAHIQHLYAYSTLEALPAGRTLYDTRFHLVKRGSAPNWEDLNGKWAVPGVGYGEQIVELQKTIFNKYPPEAEEPPSSGGESPEPSPVHWAKPCNDELMEAGLLYNDHSNTLDQPASEGMVICLINRLRKEFLKNG